MFHFVSCLLSPFFQWGQFFSHLYLPSLPCRRISVLTPPLSPWVNYTFGRRPTVHLVRSNLFWPCQGRLLPLPILSTTTPCLYYYPCNHPLRGASRAGTGGGVYPSHTGASGDVPDSYCHFYYSVYFGRRVWRAVHFLPLCELIYMMNVTIVVPAY